MKSIAQLVGLPPRHFQRLYQDLVDNLADHIATCNPVSNPNEHLHHILYVSERALNIRQRYLLPEHTAPEEIARRGDRWTYGVFLAALFHDLRRLDAASPASSPDGLEALARSLAPDVGLDWLASEPELMTAWLAIVAGDMARSGVLGTIIGQVVELPDDADPPDEQGDRDPSAKEEEPETGEPSTALDLASGIREIVADGRLQINVADDAWVTETDLWLNRKEGLDVVRQWVAEETSSSPLKSNELLGLLQESELCVRSPKKQQAVWQMRIMQGIVMKKRSLIRIPIDRIWPNLTDRPPFFEGEIT